jgi:Type I phosphodiesterase / nucleotide pyrophosphatase
MQPRLLLVLGLFLTPLLAAAPQPAPALVAANVFVVTLDGMRWQEVFGGMTADLNNKEHGGVADVKETERRFAASAPDARRERLMPFLWSVVARQGQVFGDPVAGSTARVTNGLRFSYPGYNELLAGFADPRIDSNDPVANPNVTVLEWLNKRPAFAGKVAAFASWELLPWILNASRSGVVCNGDGPPVAEPATDREHLLNEFAADLPPYWGQTRFDAPTGLGALEYVRTRRPRVLYVMLGETDEWAHGRRYDLYLDAAQRNDRFIRRLWTMAQALPEYANRTGLIVTTDHGRGSTAADWPNHGRDVPAAERIWIAVMGPSVPALGVRANTTATQAQVAATIATLVGEDYVREQPKAAPPLNLR